LWDQLKGGHSYLLAVQYSFYISLFAPLGKKFTRTANVGWTVLLHPPSCPDLAPSDYYYFFGPKLSSTHCVNNKAQQHAMCQWLQERESNFYRTGMLALVRGGR